MEVQKTVHLPLRVLQGQTNGGMGSQVTPFALDVPGHGTQRAPFCCVTFAPGGFQRPPKEAAHNGFVLPVSGRISVSQVTQRPNKEGGRSVGPGLRPLPPAYELVWQRV